MTTPARTTRRAVTAIIALALLAVACSGSDDAGDDSPATTTADSSTTLDTAAPESDLTVTGPIEGGTYGVPFNTLPLDLIDEYDYVEEEYFIDGQATSYSAEGEWGSDGVWPVTERDEAPFTTRVIVRRPADPADFNGTVVVEWLNVSGGLDADPVFGLSHIELLREGYAYAGVSAQAVGIEGGGFEIPIEGIETQPLKEWDPERYGDLTHPGDDYSYDIFTQATEFVRGAASTDPLDGYDIEAVIGAGESQSAIRMATYVNAVYPVAGVHDGFLIHSRGGGSAAIESGGGPTEEGDVTGTETVFIRDDLDVPVFQFVTESDLFGLLDFSRARQPDNDLLRTWEIAGTAHADQATLDYALSSGARWNSDTTLDLGPLCGRINEGPQRFALRRAIAALRAWIVDGTPPATVPAIESFGGAIARDTDGIALGGLRTPDVDAPTLVLSGEQSPDAGLLCILFGTTTPLPDERLAELYPDDESYVTAVRAAADAAVEADWLLPADAEEMVQIAESRDPVG